jgi:putative aminopeptidase FrvX
MKKSVLLQLAERLLSLPTAPYHEHQVRAVVEEHCRALGLCVARDEVGNVIARWPGRPGKRRSRSTIASGTPPLVFVAHMDHPGFEALGGGRAEFLGGVPREMFAAGARARFYTAKGIVPARVKRLIRSAWPKRKLVELAGDGNLRRGDMGMWDLPAFRVRGDRLRAAGIDDVLSVVVLLATLTELVRRRVGAHVWGVFTRAEEPGFHGAIALARSARIPRPALIVSLEMSKERPSARIGRGPVVRVGDGTTMFDPLATLFLEAAARRAAIRAQRCLMDGGTCEAVAFMAQGYRVGGLCLPLGNYHNIGPHRRPAAEYVSVNDLEQLIRLTVTAATRWREFDRTADILRKQMDQISRCAPRPLRDR